MTSEFKTAYRFDDAGYFEHELSVQVIDGEALMPPSATLLPPWGDAKPDDKVFYRFDGESWKSEAKPTCAAECVGVVISHTTITPHDEEMRELIRRFAQEEGYREKRGEDLSWSVEKIPEKTEAEKREEAEKSVRAKRDSLISETDYLLASDYPISAEDLEAVKVYRQALRDVPQQEGFPFDVVWPDLPVIVAER
jgi:hypothetical protein|nr:tail fiber assembly protein [uncultured Sutterella sp.]